MSWNRSGCGLGQGVDEGGRMLRVAVELVNLLEEFLNLWLTRRYAFEGENLPGEDIGIWVKGVLRVMCQEGLANTACVSFARKECGHLPCKAAQLGV